MARYSHSEPVDCCGEQRSRAIVIEHRETTIRPTFLSWVFILFHLGLGFVTIALAVDDGFAEGKVTFESDAWRYAFLAAGVFLTYRAARALVRAINRATIALTPGHYRVARLHGFFMLVIGAGFIVAARSEEPAQRSVALYGWADDLYLVGSVLLVIGGLFQMVRPPAQRTPAA